MKPWPAVAPPKRPCLSKAQKLTDSLYPRVRGNLVPAEAFDEAMRWRDEYRKTHPPAAR